MKTYTYSETELVGEIYDIDYEDIVMINEMEVRENDNGETATGHNRDICKST